MNGDAPDDYVVMEISIQYLDSPGSVDVDCDGTTLTMTGVSLKAVSCLFISKSKISCSLKAYFIM